MHTKQWLAMLVAALMLAVTGAGAEEGGNGENDGNGDAGDGLVLHYTFDEGEGEVARDASGEGHDGKLAGAVWVKAGDGHALQFDGEDDYVDCGTDQLDLTGSFTLAAWVRHRVLDGWQDYMGNYLGGSRGVTIAQNGGLLYFHNGGLTPYSLDVTALKLRQKVWHHVAAVYNHDAHTMKVYVNGLEAADQQVTGTPRPSTTKPFTLGRYEPGKEQFDGLMDQVRVYERALTEAQVMALFSGDWRSKVTMAPIKPGATGSVDRRRSGPKTKEKPPVEDSDVLLGMRIEKATQEGGAITVTATGSVFALGADGEITCTQRIPIRREVARLTLPADCLPLTLAEQDDFTCTINGKGVSLRMQGDSLLIIKADREVEIGVTGLLVPAYHQHKAGNRLFIDEQGGFGVYPSASKQTVQPEVTAPPWQTAYTMQANEELWVSVFPPRPYNWERSFQSLAHEGSRKPLEKYAYPSEAIIRDTARFCDIFAVHSYIWPGGDRAPWLIPEFVPSDEKKFWTMADAVRDSGMKLVLYLSPYYYRGEDFFGELRGLLKKNMTDGFYFDGVSMDFRTSYRFVRHSRRILGDDRILYIHCSTDPLGSAAIYCPFIDTYADYILRGEAGRGGAGREKFLRWICSGYNISNTVGIWCYYGSTGSAGYVHKVPTEEDIDAALDNHVRLWRTWMAWAVIGKGDVSAFDTVYYPKLNKLREKVVKEGKPEEEK